MEKLVRVILGRDWNKHKEGSNLSVDSVRAAWLKKSGYLEKPQQQEEKKAKPRERVSKPKTD